MRRTGLRGRSWVAPTCLSLGLLFLLWLRPLLKTTWTIVSLPLVWTPRPRSAIPPFLLTSNSSAAGAFDVTFASYPTNQTHAGHGIPDRVPAVLHHIQLGAPPPTDTDDKWAVARQTCLAQHPGWTTHLWDDAKAATFVRERFPHLLAMWQGYRYPIQKIDALRYMVLYEYGGVVLDMDLLCRRALGPLRRFDFVAPAAHPVGISNGFMMASEKNPFLRDVLDKLPSYDRHWFMLPYPTVMFSTGCHYVSVMHALQPDRTSLKVLAGPPGRYGLHSLNGHAVTPIFEHLGSSAWHSFDAALIVLLGRLTAQQVVLLVVVALGLGAVAVRAWLARRARKARFVAAGVYRERASIEVDKVEVA